MAVVVVGSFFTDIISYVDRLPQPGETLRGKSLSIGCGGKGANQCIAAAKLGAECAMIGKLGKDSFGEMHLSSFNKEHVHIQNVTQTEEAPTGLAQIVVDSTAQNSIVIIGGANDKLSAGDVQIAQGLLKSSKVVVTQLEVNMEATIEAMLIANAAKVKTIFNAAPAALSLPDEIYRLSTIFCVNESEAEMLTGQAVDTLESAEEASCILKDRGAEIVLLTLGSRGAYLKKDGEKGLLVPAPAVRAVDTTGAGDSFIGSLAYYMAYHPSLTLEEMVRRSCIVAAYSVQKPGTQLSFPTKTDLPNELFS